jgi:hypothetical protein
MNIENTACKKKMYDSYVKAVLVNKGKKPFQDELIICTTLFHGSCEKRNFTTLESLPSSGHSIMPVVSNNKTASTVAFLAPGPNTDGTSQSTALYVGASWTNTGLRIIRSLVPAFSSRNAQNFDFTNRGLVSNSYTSVDEINRYSLFSHIAQEIGYFIMSPKAYYLNKDLSKPNYTLHLIYWWTLSPRGFLQLSSLVLRHLHENTNLY